MVKEYQLDPVTHQLLHADFYAAGHGPRHHRHGAGGHQG